MDHGELPIPAGELPTDDPALLNIFADYRTWSAAHPCECEGMCECDGPADWPDECGDEEAR